MFVSRKKRRRKLILLEIFLCCKKGRKSMSALRTFTRSYSSSPNIFKHIEKIASVIRALVDTRPFFPPLHDPCTSLSTTCPSTLSEPRLPRNWIVILFSKAICKCYQKVSSRHALPPPPPSISLSFPLSFSKPFFFLFIGTSSCLAI